MLPTEYKELTKTLLGRAAEMGVPMSGTFELTSRCNLECAMCYIRTRAGDRAMKASELSTAEWLDLARQGVDAGMMFLLLTGGEVFLRPDFFDIYEPLTEMGLLLTLFTNATLITSSGARRLGRRPPGRTEITLYGASEETYAAVTGHQGGYARCIRGIELLLDAGIKPKLKTTLSRINAHEFDTMQEMADRWGLSFSAAWLLTKRRDFCSSSIEDIRFSASEAVDMEFRDVSAVERFKTIAARPEPMKNEDAFYCHAGRSSFVIGPSGDMNICIDLCLPRARPTEVGFLKAWQEVKDFIPTVPQSSNCASCELSDYCARCPAWSYVETGGLSNSVDYLCEVAKERKDRIAEVISA